MQLYEEEEEYLSNCCYSFKQRFTELEFFPGEILGICGKCKEGAIFQKERSDDSYE